MNHLSMLGLKLIYISKRGERCQQKEVKGPTSEEYNATVNPITSPHSSPLWMKQPITLVNSKLDISSTFIAVGFVCNHVYV